METLVWAVNLLAVTYLCFWASKQDVTGSKGKSETTKNGKRED